MSCLGAGWERVLDVFWDMVFDVWWGYGSQWQESGFGMAVPE